MMKVARAALVGTLGCLIACFSPVGAWRELRSDRHPTQQDVIGVWRVTPETATQAAETGLPLADAEAGMIALRPDGTCRVDLFLDPCGHFPTQRRQPSEVCRWDLQGVGDASVSITLGEKPHRVVFGVHHLAADPPILWQYICDPDAAEYLEFKRETL